MDFVSNKKEQIEEMLKTVGVVSVDEFFTAIPAELRLPRPQQDDGLSEYEGLKHLKELAAKNTFIAMDSYLGGGAYEHHVPALVQAVCSKSEFLTSYTPYQAEASQGMLQAIFEFQSAICALTGMDAANASVYDGASACAEALLMCLRASKNRTKLLIAGTLNPFYRGVVDQYLVSHTVDVITIPMTQEGSIDLGSLGQELDGSTAAVLVQSPNYLGIIEDVKTIAAQGKAAGALTIQCANPLAYGLYPSAAENGADIAVGECQPFGLALSFGGPYAGYLACRQELLRQLPGRIVGETVDAMGDRGFVLTLQAREQHIRREKATSNICTNQALAALGVLVAILWYGKAGIPALALTNFRRAAYLKDKLCKIRGISLLSDAPSFNEFVVAFDRPLEELLPLFRKHQIEPGVPLCSDYPSLKNHLLVAVTETKNKEQLDKYVKVAREIMEAR